MDFAFQTVTRERKVGLIPNLYGVVRFVWGGALLILVAIPYSKWPPGGCLGFCIPDHYSRKKGRIDPEVVWCSRMGTGRYPVDFGFDPIFKMAARAPSLISLSGP